MTTVARLRNSSKNSAAGTRTKNNLAKDTNGGIPTTAKLARPSRSKRTGTEASAESALPTEPRRSRRNAGMSASAVGSHDPVVIINKPLKASRSNSKLAAAERASTRAVETTARARSARHPKRNSPHTDTASTSNHSSTAPAAANGTANTRKALAKAAAGTTPKKAAKKKGNRSVTDEECSAAAVADSVEVQQANFIMSSPKRKQRSTLTRSSGASAADAPATKRRRGGSNGDAQTGSLPFSPPLSKRLATADLHTESTPTREVRKLRTSRRSKQNSDNNGDAPSVEAADSSSSDSRHTADAPPSPLKTIFSPVLDLLRRVSGIAQDPLGRLAQDTASFSGPLNPPDAHGNGTLDHSTLSDGSDISAPAAAQPTIHGQAGYDVAAASALPASGLLTAPPMNPTTMGTSAATIAPYMPQPSIEPSEGSTSSSTSTSPSSSTRKLAGYPETPSKENIPVGLHVHNEYEAGTPLTARSNGAVTAAVAVAALAGTSGMVANGNAGHNCQQLANEDDLDASNISSLAGTDIDSQYDQYLPYDDEDDELNPFLFMADLPPVPKEHTLRPYALPRKTRSSPPITLVLDLDETLVHCALTRVDDPDLIFPVEYNGLNYDVYCRLRPGYREFLERASKLFEVVIFTASQQVYADRLLNLIDPERRYIRHRLFRDSCVYVNTNYVKDLGILGRDESKVLLVDNCPQAYAYQQSNGIPIESWYEDKSDRELHHLMEFLETLVGAEDVRPAVDAQFKTREKVAEAKQRYQNKLSTRQLLPPMFVRGSDV